MRRDLVYSIDAEAGETTFTAQSRGGHDFMDARTFTVPNKKVDAIIKQAEKDGLVVVPLT